MKLIKYEDGTYGVRNFWAFVWFYCDLKSTTRFSWSVFSCHFKDCKGTKTEAEKALQKYAIQSNSKHTVVK